MQFEHGYALLIGVGEIDKHAEWSLPMTVNDANELHALLINPYLCGYFDDQRHIRVLTNSSANKQAILDGLDWLADCAHHDPDATILIFFSGHGWVDNRTGDYYLVQHDVRPDNIAGTALSAHIMTEKLRAINAQRLLVIFDCCHAQGMATAKDGMDKVVKLPPNLEIAAVPKTLINDLKQGKGRAVFTSSLGYQRSWMLDDQISLYTHHLLEALEGAGNKPGDTTVRLSNLMNYLGEAVPSSAQRLKKEQTPFFDTASEDFPIALIQGGKGLGPNGWVKAEPPTSQIPSSQVNQVVGNGGVAIGGTASGNTIMTGKNHRVNQSNYTIKDNEITNSAIGDGAKVTNTGDININNSRVGSVTGVNNGTMNYNAQQAVTHNTLITLQLIIDQATQIAEMLVNEDHWEQMQLILVALNTALRAEQQANQPARLAKIQQAQRLLSQLAPEHNEFLGLQQQINQLR